MDSGTQGEKPMPKVSEERATTCVRLLSFTDLRLLKGIRYGRDHLRTKWKAGEFPEPVRLSPKRIAWREADIDKWIGDLTAKQPLVAKRSNRKAAA
jgi:predicted DNA-binding transcriptional regulator AlpA